MSDRAYGELAGDFIREGWAVGVDTVKTARRVVLPHFLANRPKGENTLRTGLRSAIEVAVPFAAAGLTGAMGGNMEPGLLMNFQIAVGAASYFGPKMFMEVVHGRAQQYGHDLATFVGTGLEIGGRTAGAVVSAGEAGVRAVGSGVRAVESGARLAGKGLEAGGRALFTMYRGVMPHFINFDFGESLARFGGRSLLDTAGLASVGLWAGLDQLVPFAPGNPDLTLGLIGVLTAATYGGVRILNRPGGRLAPR